MGIPAEGVQAVPELVQSPKGGAGLANSKDRGRTRTRAWGKGKAGAEPGSDGLDIGRGH